MNYMNRRAFIQLLGAATTGVIIEPELIVAPKKYFFIHRPTTRQVVYLNKHLTHSQLVSFEIERLTPHIIKIFEQDYVERC